MSYKLLLAEGIEVMKEAARDEIECDRLQTKYAESSKYHDQLPSLRRQYAAVFDKRIRALEMINHVRVNTDDVSLKKFCADTMEAGMDACERVRDKETSILLPAGLVQGTFAVESMMVVGERGKREQREQIRQTGVRTDGLLITKDGYSRIGQPIFSVGHDGADTVSGSDPFRQDFELNGGAYQLAIVNNDKFAVASPIIEVVIQCESPSTGQKMLYRKKLPAGCAWCRFIGVVTKTSVKLAMTSDAWMRHSKIRVELSRISKFKDRNGNPIDEDETPFQHYETDSRGRPGGGAGYNSGGSGSTTTNAMRNKANGANASTALDSDEPVPSWIANGNVPMGYIVDDVNPNEMAPMSVMLAPAAVVGPSSKVDGAAMVGARAVAGTSAASASEAFSMANPNYKGPRVEISPLNCSPEERLRRIRNASWQWYEEAPPGHGEGHYYQTETEANRELLTAIRNLAEPTPIGE